MEVNHIGIPFSPIRVRIAVPCVSALISADYQPTLIRAFLTIGGNSVTVVRIVVVDVTRSIDIADIVTVTGVRGAEMNLTTANLNLKGFIPFCIGLTPLA